MTRYFSQSRIYLSSPCIDQYTLQTPFQRLTLRMTRFYTSQPSVKVWNRLQHIMRKMGYDARTSADKVFTGMGPYTGSYTGLIRWPHTLASYTGLSLVPRPFPPLVFDRLQYANTEGEGLGDLVTCGYVR